MSKVRWTFISVLTMSMILFPFPARSEQPPGISTPEALVERARITLQHMAWNPNFSWIRKHLKEARGVFIVPQWFKGGFIVGGSGGSGVLCVRDPQSGQWSDPVFYTMGGLSIGLQMGAESAEVILMVMTQRGIQSFYASSFKLGGDASVAAGPVGLGMEAATPYNLSADLISFSWAKGAFAGMSLAGAFIKARNDWNRLYYKMPVSPVDILVLRKVTNPQSAALREVLQKAAR